MERKRMASSNERGIALIMALVSLLVVAVIAVVLMTSLNIERKISGGDLRDSQSLNLAEAGVGEAMSRIRNFDISLPQGNPRAVAQIFLDAAGSVPVLGTDSVAIETKQPAGQWLTYTAANKGPDVLTVEFKTNRTTTQAPTAIYYYNASKSPMVGFYNGISGSLPVYRITSTGRKGSSRVRVQADVIQKPYNVLVKGAFCAGVPLNFGGNCHVCGNNHVATTPTGTMPPPSGNCAPYETGVPTQYLPGGWSDTTITFSGSGNTVQGNPAISASNTNMFYTGPWDMFGMGQSEFYSWIGAPINSEPSPPKGILYLDNNTTTFDQSGNFAYQGGDGEGFLYVDGDMHISGNFTFRGLVYIEGDLDINGTCWILGGLVCRGQTQVNIANGNFTVLYSADAIAQALAKYGGQFVTLGWREVPLN